MPNDIKITKKSGDDTNNLNAPSYPSTISSEYSASGTVQLTSVSWDQQSGKKDG